MTKRFAVVYTEYERGWGSKQFYATFHNTLEEAEAEERRENAKNTESVAPDYYIRAQIVIVTEENKNALERLAK